MRDLQRSRTPSSAASKFGERQRDDFASPLQRLLCADEKRTTKQNRQKFLISSKPMQNNMLATFVEIKPNLIL